MFRIHAYIIHQYCHQHWSDNLFLSYATLKKNFSIFQKSHFEIAYVQEKTQNLKIFF